MEVAAAAAAAAARVGSGVEAVQRRRRRVRWVRVHFDGSKGKCEFAVLCSCKTR